ncbi:MAG: glycosyltransferase family 4 protein [Sedimentisphaerales bacterium]|jgi:glycosyltransferase involved in cell wall biosynthesis
MSKVDDKLKILLLAPQKAVGGIATWAKILLKYSNPKNVDYLVIDTSKLYAPLGKQLGIVGAVCGLWDAIIRFYRVLKALFFFKPHSVYFTCAPSIGMVVRDAPLMILLRLIGKPSVVHLHGGNVQGFFGGFFLRRWLARAGMRCCNAIFVITRDVEKTARELFGGDKVIYVPNMLDDDFVNNCKLHTDIQNNCIKIIHVAWQAPEKGSFDMIEALNLVQADMQCDLIGKASPEYEKSLNSTILKYGIESKIRLTGLLTGADLQRSYEQADIFALPTHPEGPEGFPMVILEAMAYALPIVATDVGNIREMIAADSDKPAGILIRKTNPIDPKDLADAFDELSANQQLRKTLGLNGRNRLLENYLASVIVPKLQKLLKNIVFKDATLPKEL